MPDDLMRLAERCEAAIGANRKLDHEINIAIGRPQEWVGFLLPRFTASLDAAMTLVPEEDDSWSLLKRPSDEGASFKATVSWTEVTRHKKPQPYVMRQPRVRWAEAATPALALCAAALKATAALRAKEQK